ncbi:MAG: hypothetical protein WD023_02840 [Ilumatobacteraceae bacterium]
MLAVHIRSYLARHRRVHWCLVALLAIAAGTLVLQQGQQLERARASWGASTVVWVADLGVGPGEPLALRAVTVPRAVVPADALAAAPPPGAIAAQQVTAGEIVTTVDVAGGPGDLVPSGWRSVAIAVDERSLAVAVGDRVDIAADGVVLAADGRVVSVGDAAVAVAVPADVAAVVAAAALDERAVLIGRGTDEGGG